MDGLTGMETAAVIRKLDGDVPIAFTTASRDHALEANRYRSIMYLEKPVNAEDVTHCLQMAEAVMGRRSNETLSITASNLTVYKIPYYEIVMVEVRGHRCLIHCLDRAPLETVTSVTIDALEKKLPNPPFLRCHRSYIINMLHKQRDDGRDFIMEGGRKAYVRLKDAAKLRAACNNFAIAQTRRGIV